MPFGKRRRTHSIASDTETLVESMARFVDLHCHLVPGLDDGPGDWETSLAMARAASADGTQALVCTPHQGGAYRRNGTDVIRDCVRELAVRIAAANIALEVCCGADVRIEEDTLQRLAAGELLTLADRGRHILLELPHDVYWPLDSLAKGLAQRQVVGILTHPERNATLAARPKLLSEVVAAGCLVQITAGSVLGRFGPIAEQVCRTWLTRRQVHFVASDAHDLAARGPQLSAAHARVAQWTDAATAETLFYRNPRHVLEGRDVPAWSRTSPLKMKRWWSLVAR